MSYPKFHDRTSIYMADARWYNIYIKNLGPGHVKHAILYYSVKCSNIHANYFYASENFHR